MFDKIKKVFNFFSRFALKHIHNSINIVVLNNKHVNLKRKKKIIIEEYFLPSPLMTVDFGCFNCAMG